MQFVISTSGYFYLGSVEEGGGGSYVFVWVFL